MQTYVEGVSSRKVKEVTEALCATSFPKGLLSRLAADPDSELERWRDRPLEAESHPCLFVGARYEKVGVDRRIVGEGVLIASAVRDDGFGEIRPARWPTPPGAKRPTTSCSVV